MSGTPLTKPLHNGSVQTGTGVSFMGSRRGSTGFTAVRSLSWTLGLAVAACAFLTTSDGALWLVSQQRGPTAQGFNLGISAAVTSIVNVILVVCCLVALVLFVGGFLRCKLLDTHSRLRGFVTKAWRQFEISLGEAFHHRSYAIEETGLGGTHCRFCLKTVADSGAIQNGKTCDPASVF